MEDPNQDIIKHIQHQSFNSNDEQIMSQLLNHTFQNSCEHSLAQFHNSKDSTNEGNYDQLLKQLSTAKQLRVQLKNQLKSKQQTIIKNALADLIRQLQSLNIQNQMLREQHQKIRMNNIHKESSIVDTPRVRKSINSIFAQNKPIKPKKIIPEFINDSISKKSQKSNNSIIHPLKPNNLSNLLKPQQINGRISLPLKRPQQLTKIEMTQKKSIYRDKQSINSSNCSMKQHQISSSQVKCQIQYQEREVYQQHNIFNQLLNVVLLEQKIYQKDITDEINININYEQQNIIKPNKNIITVENLEKRVQETADRLEKLQTVLKMYQQSIYQTNQDVNTLTNTTVNLLKSKQSLLKQQQKCKNKSSLIKQLKQKQIKLKEQISKSRSKVKYQQVIPESLKAMLTIIIGRKSNVPLNSKNYLDEIRRIILNPKQFKLYRQNKKTKNKQLIESIKQGRIKFKQLQDIYIGRINKLKDKISKISKNK